MVLYSSQRALSKLVIFYSILHGQCLKIQKHNTAQLTSDNDSDEFNIEKGK